MPSSLPKLQRVQLTKDSLAVYCLCRRCQLTLHRDLGYFEALGLLLVRFFLVEAEVVFEASSVFRGDVAVY